MEQHIRARGLHRVELGVEESNPRARALYERLGYVAFGSEPDAWDEQAADGTIVRYETVCTLMRKELPPTAPAGAASGTATARD
jgi:ribosomal protein S18 acetylase RimI-like enzyme